MSQEENPAYGIVIDIEHIPRAHVHSILIAAAQTKDAAPSCVWILHNRDDSSAVKLTLPFTNSLHDLPLTWVSLPAAVTTSKDTFSYFAGVLSQSETPDLHLVLVSNRVNSCNPEMFSGDVRFVKTSEELIEFCDALGYTVEPPKKRTSSASEATAEAKAPAKKKTKAAKSKKTE